MTFRPTALSDACEFVLDGTHGSPSRTPAGIPVLSAQNVVDGGLDMNTQRFTSQEEFDAFHRRLAVRPGDVLLTIVGTIGRAAIVSADMPFVLQRSVAVLRPRPHVSSRYLYHAITQPDYRSQLARATNQSSQAGVYLGKLNRTIVPLPPLPEQKRIATVLDKADAIRRKRQESIRLADDFLRSAFLDMFGDPVTNPKGWPMCVLSEIADIASGVTKGRKLDGCETVSIPYMRVANVQDGEIMLDDVANITVLPEDVNRYALQPGDILLTEGGDPDKLGRGAVWHGEISPCIHQNHIFRVRVAADAGTPEFVSAMLGSALGKRYFFRCAKQTTGIASINMTQLKQCPVLLPPLARQQDYTALCRRIRQAVLRYESAASDATMLFQSLSHRAFAGEL